jgi:hypothetical protein
MSFYHTYLNKLEIEKLIDNAGKCCHQIRNYTQGYVNATHPEIQTIDNICGQLEGQCRALKSNLVQNVDLKPTLVTCARLSNFLKKISSVEVFADKDFENSEQDKLETILLLINSNINILQQIDFQVNLSIIKMSQDLFNNRNKSNFVVNEIPYKNIYEINIEEIFKADCLAEIISTNSESEMKKILSLIGFKLSNNSHSIQEKVAEYIQSPAFKDVANKIIQVAGEIENQGRAIIAESVTSKDNYNFKNLTKLLVNSNNSISQLKDISTKQCEYLIKNNDTNNYLITNAIKLIEKTLIEAESLIQKKI